MWTAGHPWRLHNSCELRWSTDVCLHDQALLWCSILHHMPSVTFSQYNFPKYPILSCGLRFQGFVGYIRQLQPLNKFHKTQCNFWKTKKTFNEMQYMSFLKQNSVYFTQRWNKWQLKLPEGYNSLSALHLHSHHIWKFDPRYEASSFLLEVSIIFFLYTAKNNLHRLKNCQSLTISCKHAVSIRLCLNLHFIALPRMEQSHFRDCITLVCCQSPET